MNGDNEYFWRDSFGGVNGPELRSRLKELYRINIICDDTEICIHGSKEWHPYRTISEASNLTSECEQEVYDVTTELVAVRETHDLQQSLSSALVEYKPPLRFPACPKCGSQDCKKISRIYAEGTFIGHANSHGVMISTSGISLGSLGGPTGHQSVLAAQCVPPSPPTKDNVASMILLSIGTICLCISAVTLLENDLIEALLLFICSISFFVGLYSLASHRMGTDGTVKTFPH